MISVADGSIVCRTPHRIAEHRPCFVDLSHAPFRQYAFSISQKLGTIGVQAPRQIPIGLPDLCIGRRTGHAQ